MSQLQTLEDVPALEHEHEATVSSPNDKVSNSASVQANTSISAVDRELEPVVTRRELWSYYCMSVRISPWSCEEIERLPSVLQWRQWRGAPGE